MQRLKLTPLKAMQSQRLLANFYRNRAYCPHLPTPKQAAFLALSGDEALYGGAAGGGKSDSLLMAALQFVHVPGYSALILRRSYADLALPNAIMDRAHQWLRGTTARWHAATKSFDFPSTAKLTFGYLQNSGDHHRYQGAEFQFCGFDELTQFQSFQYRYLFSRLRRLEGVDIPIRMRGATNPGGVGHEWVKRRFILRKRWNRVFISAKLDENPYLDRDEYERSLRKLDSVTRARLLKGDWFVSSTGLVYPTFHECSVTPDQVPWERLGKGEKFGGIDWGFNNPFAACQAVLDDDDVLWVTWCRYKRGKTVGQHAAHMPRDDQSGEGTMWFADPSRPENIRELVNADFRVVPARNNVEAGLDIVEERIRTGRLKVVSTLTPLFTEAGLYTRGDVQDEDDEGDEEEHRNGELVEGDDDNLYDPSAETSSEEPVKDHDHSMDALRYMCVGIAMMKGSHWSEKMADVETRDPEEAERELLEQDRRWRRLDNPHFWPQFQED
jgi:Terminase large subunit, T4likevirus-type, N-terminal